ncbi:unnamed protein product [Caenorhabditis auriculariae]|uniref:Uncharacterized protein n=1 Tax=Caenorhabditis auriculariae TaxID=2777116 RepID=A0A8S1HIG0_9PELO|nr:unnamed protein product [Caenorhabditis auriculariae]
MEKLPKNESNRDPFTHMEEERRSKDRELADKRENLERTFNEKTLGRRQRNKERSSKLDDLEKENREKLEERRAELFRLRHEVEEMRRGNLTSSQTSLATSYNENTMRGSPPDKSKKRMGTLGLFNRN